MLQPRLMTFGINVYHFSTFIEAHARLEPLWRDIARRKHESNTLSCKSVAKLMVHDESTLALYIRLKESHRRYTGQIASFVKEQGKQFNKQDPKMKSLLETTKSLKITMATLWKLRKQRVQELKQLTDSLPNTLHPSVPDEVVVLNSPKIPAPSLHTRDHVQIGAELDLFDLQTATYVSGHRFVYLKGDGALLALALENWAIDFVMNHGFSLLSTPDVINNNVLAGCGFRPDGPASQIYGVSHGRNHGLSLAGTAEIPLVSYYANKNIESELKEGEIRVCAASNCYRAEAGDRGRKIRGLYRLHQFRKVEMVCITPPNRTHSDRVFKKLVNIQRSIYSSLHLPYRVLNIPADDLGDVATRKIDLEVHMPGMRMYGEVTSASECLSYQSSRLNIRCGDRFAYTLNATAVAIPRTLIGIIENYQRPDGSVGVPLVLQPYMKCASIKPKQSRSVKSDDISQNFLDNSSKHQSSHLDGDFDDRTI